LKHRSKIQKRTSGQTVTFDGYEWLYVPFGIGAATIRQIEELTAKKEGVFEVIQWPEGELVFSGGKWLDREKAKNTA
jgi:hypothetical protein